jgi:hypothetical protein
LCDKCLKKERSIKSREWSAKIHNSLNDKYCEKKKVVPMDETKIGFVGDGHSHSIECCNEVKKIFSDNK